jgi:phospholipid/cholesterol/gamma-HCH transport system substrate-binding protein
MENKAHAIAAGLFLLLLGFALAASVAWFQGDRTERVHYTVVARSGVPGLNLKAPVKLRGVEVGYVDSIGFDPADPRQILVDIAVDAADTCKASPGCPSSAWRRPTPRPRCAARHPARASR